MASIPKTIRAKNEFYKYLQNDDVQLNYWTDKSIQTLLNFGSDALMIHFSSSSLRCFYSLIKVYQWSIHTPDHGRPPSWPHQNWLRAQRLEVWTWAQDSDGQLGSLVWWKQDWTFWPCLEEHQVQRNPGTIHDPSKAIPTEKQGGGCGSDWTGSPPNKTLTLTLSQDKPGQERRSWSRAKTRTCLMVSIHRWMLPPNKRTFTHPVFDFFLVYFLMRLQNNKRRKAKSSEDEIFPVLWKCLESNLTCVSVVHVYSSEQQHARN